MVIQDEYEAGDVEDMKKSCIIYDSWAELIGNLPNEVAGQLMKMVLGYAFNGEFETCDDPVVNAMFSMIKTKVDEDNAKYQEKVERMKNNSSRNRNDIDTKSKRNQNEVDTESERNQNDVESVSEYVSVSDNDKDKKDILSDAAKTIVDHLNDKAGTKFKSNSKATSSQIKARLAEGYTVEDFLIVIDKKVKAWKDDPKMSAYLRPETLFCSKHFESYLNEIVDVKSEAKKAASSYSSDIPQATFDKIHNYSEREVNYAELERFISGR